MRKTLTIFTAVAAVSAAIFACVSNNDKGVRLPDKQMAAIEEVGVRHNQGLDSIFNELMGERVRLFEQSTTRSSGGYIVDPKFPETYDFDALIRRATTKLVKEWHPDADVETLNAAMPKGCFDVRTRAASDTETFDVKAKVEAMLTPFQREYDAKLDELLNKEGQSVEQFVADVRALEEQILAEAPTRAEAEFLLLTTSVARNSAEYWAKNAPKWAAMLNAKINKVYHMGVATTRSPEDGHTNCKCPETAPQEVSMADGFYAYPKCPNLFYAVSNGYIMCMECPDGLIFNPERCICDWPDNFDWKKLVDADKEGAKLGGDIAGAAEGALGAIVGGFFGGIGGAAGLGGVSATVGHERGKLYGSLGASAGAAIAGLLIN